MSDEPKINQFVEAVKKYFRRRKKYELFIQEENYSSMKFILIKVLYDRKIQGSSLTEYDYICKNDKNVIEECAKLKCDGIMLSIKEFKKEHGKGVILNARID